VWVFISKLYLVLKRVVAGLIGVLRNGGGLGTGESYIPVMLFGPLLHRSSCSAANVDFSAFPGNRIDHAVLFGRIDGLLWSQRTKCELVSCRTERRRVCLVVVGSGDDVLTIAPWLTAKPLWTKTLSQALSRGYFSFPGELLHEGGGITVRNKDRWHMFLFLRDDWLFGYDTFCPVVQTLNKTAFYWLRVVWIIRKVLISFSWFSIDTGGKSAVRFSQNWRVMKGDLVVFLGFHGKADGGLLTVEMA